MLRTLKIFVIIMTTFYVNGCVDNNDDAIKYFESRFFGLEKVIEADNDFQNVLDDLLSDTPDDTIDENDYTTILATLKEKFELLNKTIISVSSNNLPVYDDDGGLDRAYKATLKKYRNVVEENYKSMLVMLEDSAEISDNDFSNTYTGASQILDEAIDLFYRAAEEYAEKNNIEIEWKND